MAKLKCINEKIIKDGAAINLNAKLPDGSFAPVVVWNAGETERDVTTTIEGEVTYSTIVHQAISQKTIQELLVETNNFELI